MRRLALSLADAAGHTVRTAAPLIRTLPGIVGAGLIAFGFGLAWLPLGFIAGGAILILIDRRLA